MIFREQEPSIKRMSEFNEEPASVPIDIHQYLTPDYIEGVVDYQHTMYEESVAKSKHLWPLYFSNQAKLRACNVPMPAQSKEESKKAIAAVRNVIKKWNTDQFSYNVGLWEEVAMMHLANPNYFSNLWRSQQNIIDHRLRDIWEHVIKDPSNQHAREYLFTSKLIAPEKMPALPNSVIAAIDLILPSEQELQEMDENWFSDFLEKYAKLRVLIPSKTPADSSAFRERLKQLLESHETKSKGRTLNYCFAARLAQAQSVTIDEHGLHIIDPSPTIITPSTMKPKPNRRTM